MRTTKAMESYYNQRAQEYERVYQIDHRQTDINQLSHELRKSLSDFCILEVACGTGYWTEVIAPSARFILASDQSLETLKVARTKQLPYEKVEFIQDDAYSLAKVTGEFDAAMAGFWWSHVPKKEIPDFLINLHRKILPGSKVVFFDNQYVEGESTPISRSDQDGNSYQLRKLIDGSTHEIIKNFPIDNELIESVSQFSKNIKLRRWKYYWMLEYETLNSAN